MPRRDREQGIIAPSPCTARRRAISNEHFGSTTACPATAAATRLQRERPWTKVVCIHGTAGGSERHAKLPPRAGPRPAARVPVEGLHERQRRARRLEGEQRARARLCSCRRATPRTATRRATSRTSAKRSCTADEGVLAGQVAAACWGTARRTTRPFRTARAPGTRCRRPGVEAHARARRRPAHETLAGDEAAAKWAKDVVAAFRVAWLQSDVCDWRRPMSKILDNGDLWGRRAAAQRGRSSRSMERVSA